MVPVNWWTGKVKPNFEKLKDYGRTAEKPVFMEPRKCTFPRACTPPKQTAWLWKSGQDALWK